MSQEKIPELTKMTKKTKSKVEDLLLSLYQRRIKLEKMKLQLMLQGPNLGIQILVPVWNTRP